LKSENHALYAVRLALPDRAGLWEFKESKVLPAHRGAMAKTDLMGNKAPKAQRVVKALRELQEL
jgi:hypothetical protein